MTRRSLRGTVRSKASPNRPNARDNLENGIWDRKALAQFDPSWDRVACIL